MTAEKGERTHRNTGWEFDLVDEDKAVRGDDGLLEEVMAHMGNYDSRHEAVGMKALLERRFDYDYTVRHHESMWTEREEPVVCGYCGHEDWYMPLVRWTHAIGVDASPFCSTECWARYQYENPEEIPDAK